MKGYLRIWALLALAAVLGGCSRTYSESDLAQAREQAYSSGYQAGLSDAAGQAPESDRYQEGFDLGWSEGYQEGYALGAEEGGQALLSSAGDSYQLGYDQGYASGYAQQDQDSQAARQQYIAAIQPAKPGASASAPAADSGQPAGDIVYVTKSGAKYHLSGCSYLSKSKIEKTLAEAKAAGYTPCGSCKPPQ